VVEPIVVNIVSNVIVSVEKSNWASGEVIYPSSSHEDNAKKRATTTNI